MTPRTRRRCWLAGISVLVLALCLWIAIGTGAVSGALIAVIPTGMAVTDRDQAARQRVESELRAALAAQGLDWGAAAVVRLFKHESELELWLEHDDGRFRRFRTWPICRWSGDLGPKLAEGDGQAPEGFYRVAPAAMNPRSRFHLSFNLGFPNEFDRAHGRTGSFLMVHGNCVSIGCYAMGDAAIEQIYTLVAAAHAGGQGEVPVLAYPFRFTDGWQQRHAGSPWLDFWQQLANVDQAFERSGQLPAIVVQQDRYRIAR